MADTERDPALLAILALVAADRAEQRPDAAVPTEFLLRDSGLTHAQIGEIVGKKANAVRMTISRHERKLKDDA